MLEILFIWELNLLKKDPIYYMIANKMLKLTVNTLLFPSQFSTIAICLSGALFFISILCGAYSLSLSASRNISKFDGPRMFVFFASNSLYVPSIYMDGRYSFFYNDVNAFFSYIFSSSTLCFLSRLYWLPKFYMPLWMNSTVSKLIPSSSILPKFISLDTDQS